MCVHACVCCMCVCVYMVVCVLAVARYTHMPTFCLRLSCKFVSKSVILDMSYLALERSPVSLAGPPSYRGAHCGRKRGCGRESDSSVTPQAAGGEIMWMALDEWGELASHHHSLTHHSQISRLGIRCLRIYLFIMVSILRLYYCG